MTTSPSNIRVLHPEYSTDSTAKQLHVDYASNVGTEPNNAPAEGGSEAESRRDQLKVISGQLKRAPIGYSIFVLSIPVIALLIVLVVNIVLSNRQYEMVELNNQLTNITQSNEALAQDLSQKSAPQSVAQQAAELGMVLPGTPASIDLATGKISGSASAAKEDDTPTNFVAEPTVQSGTGTPAEADVPADDTSDSVTVTNEKVPGPESDTVKIPGPQTATPDSDVTNSPSNDGVANDEEDDSVGSLQGPQVRLPADN